MEVPVLCVICTNPIGTGVPSTQLYNFNRKGDFNYQPGQYRQESLRKKYIKSATKNTVTLTKKSQSQVVADLYLCRSSEEGFFSRPIASSVVGKQSLVEKELKPLD